MKDILFKVFLVLVLLSVWVYVASKRTQRRRERSEEFRQFLKETRPFGDKSNSESVGR